MSKNIRYELPAGLAVGQIKNEYFVFDSTESAYKSIDLQVISKPMFVVFEKLLLASKEAEFGQTYLSAFKTSEEKEIISALLEAGYLKPKLEKRTSASRVSQKRPMNLDKYFTKPTFFGVPNEFPEKKADVALLSVPISHRYFNQGTSVGADLLRAYTTEHFHLFKIFQTGIYSEMNLRGEPKVIGKGLALKDYGNVGDSNETVAETVERLKLFWKKIGALKQNPIFVGGDHSISYLTLLSLQQVNPALLKKITIVHLDAHNDCYGDGEINLSHSSVIHSILETLPVKKILSFGLRTSTDVRAATTYWPRVQPHLKSGKLQQFGMQKMREIFKDEAAFKKLLGKDALVYFTFDLDFICSRWVDGAVSTAVAEGADWNEVHQCIELIQRNATLMGADLVEYNPLGANAQVALRELSQTILLLAEAMKPSRKTK